MANGVDIFINRRHEIYMCNMLQKYFFILSIMLLYSCSKTPIETLDVDKFYELIDAAEGESTSFLFFTDPHLHENNETFEHYLRTIEYNYKQVPLEFCLCGGDWLDHGDTNQLAIDKLIFIDDYVHSLFGDNYYPVLGNHDTNYQGRLNSDADIATGGLSHDVIVNLLFREQNNSYYSFQRSNARFFVFDTGLDWYSQMDNFRWEQVCWFAKELQTNIDDNIVIIMHIYTNDLKSPAEFSQYIMQVSESYNERGNISLNGTQYDFSETEGSIACVLCGHCHQDFIDQTYSIPVIGTTHLKTGDVATFDLCVFNWDKKVLNLLRVGAGSDRIVYLPKGYNNSP